MASSPELSCASLLKLVSFLFWSFMYLSTAEKHPDKSPEWCSRVITLLHGSVAALIGLSQCRMLTPWHLTRKVMPSQYGLMLWSWGYFAFDLLWCLVYWSESSLILAHHTSALVAITRYIQKDYTGCTFSCTIALLELTNPFLQLRWFLRYEGYGNTLVFFAVEVVYLTMFIVLRGILGTYIILNVLRRDYFDAEEKLFSLVFYVVSMLFIYDIVGYILHTYRKEVRGLKRLYLTTCLQFDDNGNITTAISNRNANGITTSNIEDNAN